jgi:hypothetical protein
MFHYFRNRRINGFTAVALFILRFKIGKLLEPGGALQKQQQNEPAR